MAESRESKTLCSCTPMLKITLKGDREILHYLDMERLISQSVYERINDPLSNLSADDKACVLVTEIKHRVKLSSLNYHKIVSYMRQNQKKYEDILAHLEEEYSKQQEIPPGSPEKYGPQPDSSIPLPNMAIPSKTNVRDTHEELTPPTPLMSTSPEQSISFGGTISRDFMQKHSCNFINRDIFYSCYYKIRPWPDISILYPYLLKYQLASSDEDRELLTSPFYLQDKSTLILKLASKGGEYGFMLLYMCIHDSSTESLGHKDAIKELDDIANIQNMPPPWEREVPRSPDTYFSDGPESPTSRPRISRVLSDSGVYEQASIYSISDLTDDFSRLAKSLKEELRDRNIQTEDLRKCISLLPLSLNENELKDVKNLTDYFIFLNMHVWNFLDYHILEFVINKFGTKKLKEDMKRYILRLADFQQKTSIKIYTEWKGREARLSNHVEVRISINSDLNSCALQKLIDLHRDLCQRLLPPLSEYAVLYYRHGPEKTTFTWTMPPILEEKMYQEIISEKSYVWQFFQDNAITAFSIQNDLIYSIKEEKILHKPEISSHVYKESVETDSSRFFTFSSQGDSSDEKSSSLFSDLNDTGDSDKSSIISNLSDTLLDGMQELVEAATGVSLSIEFSQRLKREKKTDKGVLPSICIDNRNTVVEVNHQAGTNWMFYRVGRLTVDGKIDWSDPATGVPAAKTYYGAGAYPRIALNDNNHMIEVHKNQFLDKCFYRLGKVDTVTRRIFWEKKNFYSPGYFPIVAINDDNNVVTVVQDDLFTKRLSYRVGHFSSTVAGIVWNRAGKQRIEKVRAETFSISMNEKGLLVLGYQTELTYHLKCQVGKVDFQAGLIEWGDKVCIGNGFTPCITINNDNHVIQIHQAIKNRRLMSNVGAASWNKDYKGIKWSEEKGVANRHYGNGLYPSVALNDHGKVVEIHEPRFPHKRNRLHYYIGELKAT